MIIESGPTGLELNIYPEGQPPFSVASRDDANREPRMAMLLAEFSKLLHGVIRRLADAPDGPWDDRWSFGFYISESSFSRHSELATAAATATLTATPLPETPRLARSLEGFGLPERASQLRALQDGGWLAKRYAARAPWPHVAAALGHPLIPIANAQPEGLYLLPSTSSTSTEANPRIRTSFTTRSAAPRSMRSSNRCE